MVTSDLLVVIQIVATILMSLIGFLLKQVIQSNLDPIKNDIHAMKNEFKEMTMFMKEHRLDPFAHPSMMSYMETKFASKQELETIEAKIDVRDNHGNH